MYYVVIGRLASHADNTTFVCKADNRAEADALFEEAMYAELTLDEVEKTALYVYTILVSDTRIWEIVDG